LPLQQAWGHEFKSQFFPHREGAGSMTEVLDCMPLRPWVQPPVLSPAKKKDYL
jgi:hypothetical protein